MKELILLDTDIGNDIDDTVTLAYLLAHSRCELLGITTVSGEPIVRAKLASALCKAAGRGDIPIYPGVEQPLLTEQKQATAHQVRYLGNWPCETQFPSGEAIEFMRRTIRKHPHEVTLLGIGPLTNIALLFAADAEIPRLLKKLVIMCGIFFFQNRGEPCLTEWNARCDPYAAAMVYNAPVKSIVSVGLDVTTQVTLEKDEILKSFNSSILKTVLAFSGIQDNTRKSITFHDPLAAAVIFNEDICEFKKGNVAVELNRGFTEGLTYWSPNENGKNKVAFRVDRDLFFEHYFKTASHCQML